MAEELLEQISAWNQELVLRGTGQLGLRDLEKLESFAAEASGLQMSFLAQLLQQLIWEGRRMLWAMESNQASTSTLPNWFNMSNWAP